MGHSFFAPRVISRDHFTGFFAEGAVGVAALGGAATLRVASAGGETAAAGDLVELCRTGPSLQRVHPQAETVAAKAMNQMARTQLSPTMTTGVTPQWATAPKHDSPAPLMVVPQARSMDPQPSTHTTG